MSADRQAPGTNATTAATLRELRALFDDVMMGVSDPDRRAKLALLREYFTHPEFREELSEFLFNEDLKREAS